MVESFSENSTEQGFFKYFVIFSLVMMLCSDASGYVGIKGLSLPHTNMLGSFSTPKTQQAGGGGDD